MAIAARHAPAREDLAQVGLEEGSGKSLERRPDRAGRHGVAGQEALLERAEAREQVAGRDAERDQITRTVEAIPEIVERRGVAARIESGDERGGRWADSRQDALELAAEQVDPTVGQTRCQETDELAV